MGAEVEVSVEVDAEVLGLRFPLELDSIQDKLGRVLHLEPTLMKPYSYEFGRTEGEASFVNPMRYSVKGPLNIPHCNFHLIAGCKSGDIVGECRYKDVIGNDLIVDRHAILVVSDAHVDGIPVRDAEDLGRLVNNWGKIGELVGGVRGIVVDTNCKGVEVRIVNIIDDMVVGITFEEIRKFILSSSSSERLT